MRLHISVTSTRSKNYFEKLEAKLLARHNHFYSYSNSVYLNTKSKIEINCPLHGNFTQIVSDHLNGVGCPDCGKVKSLESRKVTLQEFKARAATVYEGLYSYTNVVIGSNTKHKVDVTCPAHGDFSVSVGNHLAGNSGGCPKCRVQQLRDNSPIWSYTKWEESGKASKQFDSFKLYVVECWKDSERFIKIGKTYTTVAKRLGFHLPYEYKVLHTVVGSPKFISELEASLHTANKQFKHIPSIYFGGMHECFSTNIIDIGCNQIKPS